MTREQGTPEEVLGYFTFRYIFRFFLFTEQEGKTVPVFPIPCSLFPSINCLFSVFEMGLKQNQ